MLTILLAKVFGLSLIIGGVAIWARKRHFVPIVGAFVEDKLTRVVVAILELTGGLFLVNTHNIWNTPVEAIVSLFGWCLLLEGSFYLLSSDETVEKVIKPLNNKSWYLLGGVFSILLGVYLAGSGFGWF